VCAGVRGVGVVCARVRWCKWCGGRVRSCALVYEVWGSCVLVCAGVRGVGVVWARVRWCKRCGVV